MTTSIDWPLLASVVVVLGAIGSLLWFFWQRMTNETRSIVSANSVSRIEYERDHTHLIREIEEVKKFNTKLGVLETQYASLQKTTDAIGIDVREIRKDVKDSRQEQSEQLTGALNRMQQLVISIGDNR